MSTTFYKIFEKKHKVVLFTFGAFIAHYIINIYAYTYCLSVWLLRFLRLFSRPPLWAVLCGCPDCLALGCPSVSVWWSVVRPFGCRGGCGGLVWGGLLPLCVRCVVALACPCRFGAFFCRPLPFSVVGWCVCLSVAFRGL